MARPATRIPAKLRWPSLALALAAALCPGARPASAGDPGPTPSWADPETDDSIFLDPAIVGSEVIEIWDERPGKPFDRDTTVRLTGEELSRRGITNLAEALELVPELNVREAGRGGRQVDIRGARRGSVKVLIDGVAVADPYYGNFDVSSIPVTDIVEIRVSTSPASPIDGAGGPGGVIEVHTRDAVGARRVETRAEVSSAPAATAAATGRSMLSRHLALRVSATGGLGGQDFAVTMPTGASAALDEERQSAGGAIRLEYRDGERRVVGDAALQRGAYYQPPGGDGGPATILLIDGETLARAAVAADDKLGRWRGQARAYAHALRRDSIYYADPTLEEVTGREELSASRVGASLLLNRPFGPSLQLIGSAVLDSEEATVGDGSGMTEGGRASVSEVAAGAQLERGPLKLDAAAGLAVPIGIGADPWPEAKLAATYTPAAALAVKLTGARKGRVPTLRERYRLDVGNQALGPEQASYGELAVTLAPSPLIKVEVASYARYTNGLVRYEAGSDMLVNTGDLTIRGVDARVEIGAERAVGGGASYSFTDAWSAELGTDPLDFLPRRRAEGWLTVRPDARLGATARVRHVGAQIDGTTELAPHTTADLSAYARFGASWLATVRVDNALDNRYPLRASGVTATGRLVLFSLQAAFE